MASLRSIILVTGGNAGIGSELASQLIQDASKHVLLGSRSVEKGDNAVRDLQSLQHPGIVELLPLDVASEESIIAAAKAIHAYVSRLLTQRLRLDALVNNAAIAMPTGTLGQQMSQCFQTNATGPLMTVEHFAPLLKKSLGTPRIINVSSGAGIIARRLDLTSPMYKINEPQYRASKSALNMITACQIVELGVDGFKVFAYCPGFTVSNLGPYNQAKNGAKPTSEGAVPMVRILNGDRDEEHGKFLTGAGQYEW